MIWMNDQPMFDVISGMFGLISGMFGLNRSSIEPGIRYSCYPLVVVFNILSWYRFHCRGMTKHLTPMCLFAVPMDARTRHFHRTVGYLENGCRKIRISSRMMMVMRRRMMMMLMTMMMMVMMTRHCEGAAAWRDSPGIWREFPLRGGGPFLLVVQG